MSPISSLVVGTTLAFVTAVHSQERPATASPDHYATCVQNNADMRDLMSPPDVPAATRRVAEFISEDEICECVKAEASPPGVSDPFLAYIEVSSVCLVSHVKRNFNRFCLSVYPEILAAMGYRSVSPSQMGSVCSCGENVVNAKLTVEGARQHFLNAYDEYKARVAGRTRQEVRRLPAPQNSFEGVLPQTFRCAAQTLGPPA